MDKKYLMIGIVFMFLISSVSVFGAVTFEDDFNRADSSSVGNDWIETGNAEILSNTLYINDNSGSSTSGVTQNPFSFETGDSLEFDFKVSATNTNAQIIKIDTLVSGRSVYLVINGGNSKLSAWYGGSYHDLFTLSTNTYYNLKIIDYNI